MLKDPEVKAVVEAALRHFEGTRYSLDEFIIMPNHVHVIVTPLGGHELSSILHSWKSFTAHQFNRRFARTGAVWQKESFDHIIRSPEHLDAFRQYIRDNPGGLVDAASRRVRDPDRDAAATPETPQATDTRRDAASTIRFGIETNVPGKGNNAAQKREHDKRLGKGTMSRAGAACPCCPAIMTMEDIRVRGQAKELREALTTVVVNGQDGKEYRLPTDHELATAAEAADHLDRVFADVPFWCTEEPTPAGGGRGAGRAFSVQGYGLMKWRDLFTPRQLFALGTFVRETRAARTAMADAGYPAAWREAVAAYLAIVIDRLADYHSTQCVSDPTPTQSGIRHTFGRFALPITWDFIEGVSLADFAGSYAGAIKWISLYADHATLIRQAGDLERPPGLGHSDAPAAVRCHRDRPAVLRRDSVFRFDGLLLCLAATCLVRVISRDGCRCSATSCPRNGIPKRTTAN